MIGREVKEYLAMSVVAVLLGAVVLGVVWSIIHSLIHWLTSWF